MTLDKFYAEGEREKVPVRVPQRQPERQAPLPTEEPPRCQAPSEGDEFKRRRRENY